MFDILIKHRRLGDISMLELYSDDSISKKVSRYYFTDTKQARKEVLISQAYDLAQKGIFVVLPDAYAHGERLKDAKAYDIFDVVNQTTVEINEIIKSYEDERRVDIKNAAIAGYSMGGFVVFEYLICDDIRIKAAAALISTPD